MSTPFGPEEHKSAAESGEPLQAGEATRFRTIVARLNDSALDRPDIQFAVKEAATKMSAPTTPDWRLLER